MQIPSASFLLVMLFLNHLTSAKSALTLVATPSGLIQGYRRDFGSFEVSRFLGIRYAQPPIGPLRFSKPVKVKPWYGIRNAAVFGPVCPQLSRSVFSGTEDCLFLNVYVPIASSESNASAKAVMVFIHGGGFIMGSASEYDPSILAHYGDVIVVTANYRLGILGFLRLDSVLVTGNYGLWDQRLAIEWVKENIASFGGDPCRITIFGESAGAASVSLQSLSPNSRGLFRRVIAQSGSASASWSVSRPAAIAAGMTAIMDQLGCTRSKIVVAMLSCLRDMSVEAIIRASVVHANSVPSLWFPTIDGDFLPYEVVSLGSSHHFKELEYMSGYNSQEGLLFLSIASFPMVTDIFKTKSIGNGSLDKGISEKMFEQILRTTLNMQGISSNLMASFAKHVYTNWDSMNGVERLRLITEFNGDVLFAAPNFDIANWHAADNAPNRTYVYYLDHMRLYNTASSAPSWLRNGSNHGDDLPLVFGLNRLFKQNTADNVTSTVQILFPLEFQKGDDAEDDLSLAVMKYWTNFAKSGNPNYPELGNLAWAQYSGHQANVQVLRAGNIQTVANGIHRRRMDFWTNIAFPESRKFRGYV